MGLVLVGSQLLHAGRTKVETANFQRELEPHHASSLTTAGNKNMSASLLWRGWSFIVMMFDSEELSEYVKSVVTGITEGIPPGHELQSTIGFKIAIVKEKTTEGGFRLYVAEATGQYTGGTVSTIEFEVGQKLATPRSPGSKP